tara:strand:- start:4706 stop:5074 length:369 start_codon:yes stop_codon:yes gene_type:complete
MRNKALVMFGGSSCHPLKWLLKENFHHCFVTILSEGYWIEIDDVMGHIKMTVVAGEDTDMVKHYAGLGYKVIQTKTKRPNIWKFNPFYGNIRVANCVGLVKSILSVNSLALTPYSLYRELRK